jgi:hypothetical protein
MAMAGNLRIVVLGALGVAAIARADSIGTLVHLESRKSATGHRVWTCIYAVGSDRATVTLNYICPQTMRFE